MSLQAGRGRPRLLNLSGLRGYERRWLSGDVAAGITVGAYLIPQVMAYAVVAGLPPIAGLWATVPALVLYSLLGSSRQLSVGPESSTALLSASIVAPLAMGDPSRYAVLSAALAVVFGLYCLIAWLMRLGALADLLSRPVLVGYLAGLAAVMVIGQLGRVTGVPVDGYSSWGELSSWVRGLDGFSGTTFVVAMSTLAFLLVVQIRWRRVPGPLLSVLLASAVVAALALDDRGVAVIGHLPAGLPPAPELALWSDVRHLLLPAVGLVVVGYSDNVLTARAYASRGSYEVDANEELLALGAANLGSGLLHGFTVSSSASRTALGAAAGSRTQLHSLVAVVMVIVTLAFARPVLAWFPEAALGALVVFAAMRLVDVGELRRIARFRRSELLLALSATLGVLALGLLYGILVAVALSVLEMLARVARPHDAILGRMPGLAGMHDIDDYPEAQQTPGLVVYRYDSPLFFANAEDFRRRALDAVDRHPGPVHWLVLNVEANVEVDITALDALEALRSALSARGITVALARVKHDLLVALEASGFADAVGRDHLYPTLPTALAAYEEWLHRR